MEKTNTEKLDLWFKSAKISNKLIDIKFCTSGTDSASLESFAADVNKLRNALATERYEEIRKI